MLKNMGLDLDRLAWVSTDGASVMVGCKSGVVTRLKEAAPRYFSDTLYIG